MRRPRYSLDKLCAYLQKHLIATFKQLRQALGRPARITVLRLLQKADGLSSYSHRGKYYTLRSIPGFNAKGLWEHREVRFSRYGNLLQTLKVLVERSDRGQSARELQEQVGVKTKHALMQLVEQEQLQRIRQSGIYVYFSLQRARAREQQQARRQQQADLPTFMLGSKARLAVEEAKAALLLFWATLDERQRRLYADSNRPRWGTGAMNTWPSSLASIGTRWLVAAQSLWKARRDQRACVVAGEVGSGWKKNAPDPRAVGTDHERRGGRRSSQWLQMESQKYLHHR